MSMPNEFRKVARVYSHGPVPYKPKRSIKGRKVHPQNLEFSGFSNSLRCPQGRRDQGPLKSPPTKMILSSIGRNLSRFVKTRTP